MRMLTATSHVSSFGWRIKSKSLFLFDEPVSPHLAARSSTQVRHLPADLFVKACLLSQDVSDANIRASVYDELLVAANRKAHGIGIVETAGGVLSPSPSGTSQADLYRPLRLPVLLVGDHQLGGIGATISAWESLHLRGYDVQSVALFAEDRYDNHSYLRDYFAERGVHSFSIQPPPARKADVDSDARSMQAYYEDISDHPNIKSFAKRSYAGHKDRSETLRSMPAEADKTIWHPFMQHSERSKDTITAMDSAYGDYFQTYSTKHDQGSSRAGRYHDEPKSLLVPAFDGSASWWTQGLGHGNPHLALTAAHAAGRYGHVMFAGAVHEPALTLAQTLIREMNNPRLSKVFFSDNGSTGMEVAVKMALRAASLREKWKPEDEISILGLKGSYHGDTIGTMDCSEPSIFNKKVEWYRGRGHWFDFPQVRMRQGQWIVEAPSELLGVRGIQQKRTFDSLDDVFDFAKRDEDSRAYRAYFDVELKHLRENEGKKLGALIMEPILLGAGGMMFVDPLYQRCLVEAVRNLQISRYTDVNSGVAWRGMPIICDEVFTGLYRLGRFSAADFIGVDPDIVVNAKLLTGGLLPLCTTTASEAIFDAFLSPDKSDALLHGHSYTAHAIGCAVANESLRTMKKLEKEDAWDAFRADWLLNDCSTPSMTKVSAKAEELDCVWSMWSQPFVASLSRMNTVDYVFALGSVLAISLKDPEGSGYASTAAAGLRDRLFVGKGEEKEWVIHSRVLGNVLYLMAALTTSPETLMGIEEKVLAAIR